MTIARDDARNYVVLGTRPRGCGSQTKNAAHPDERRMYGRSPVRRARCPLYPAGPLRTVAVPAGKLISSASIAVPPGKGGWRHSERAKKRAVGAWFGGRKRQLSLGARKRSERG